MIIKNISIWLWLWLPFAFVLSFIIDLLATPYLALNREELFTMTRYLIIEVKDRMDGIEY